MYVPEKIIAATKNSPEITLDPEGLIKIRGRYMYAYKNESYKEIECWIDRYICNPADITSVDIYLEYFSGINSKIFLSLFEKISSVKFKNKELIINWFYEEGDEDIHEIGEYLSSRLNTPFNFIEVYEEPVPEFNTIQ